MLRIIEQKIINQSDQDLLIDVLFTATELSKQTLKLALEKGCVWLNQGQKISRVRRAKKPLNTGDEVFIYFNEEILASIPAKPALLLDKQAYSVWFKPAGVFAQGSKWGDHCTLPRMAEKQLNRNSFLVHRLDRATSGLMMVAHTKIAARALSDLFAQRKVSKTYLAIVEGIFPDKTISLDEKIDGKNALSHATLIDENAHSSLLKVTIETGRKHQIRKHLSGFGYPIIGDRLYGNNHQQDLQLQAIQLAFVCPINKQNINVVLTNDKKLHLIPKLNA